MYLSFHLAKHRNRSGSFIESFSGGWFQFPELIAVLWEEIARFVWCEHFRAKRYRTLCPLEARW